jgi:hypothetical protein
MLSPLIFDLGTWSFGVDSTGLVQLLVEVALIDLEAGDIQRFGQPDVAFIACLMCCRAESFDPVRQLS